jgi:hypothetical protein
MKEQQYRIHPSIGVGRLGNSPDSYYLAPEAIGGLPIEPDKNGNPVIVEGKPQYVREFKDEKGMIKRQAATFKIYRTEADGSETMIDMNDPRIKKIEWTVHVANKKAAWWNFVPLLGDLMFGELNSYETWNGDPPPAWNLPPNSETGDPWTGLPWMNWRNAGTTGRDARRQLIIDPGPRTLSGAGGAAYFDNHTDYKFVSFPESDNISQGLPVKTLGEMRTDSNGNLLVLGGFGRAGGSETITGFGGGDTWHDDIADGPVTATIHFNDDDLSPVELKAWVVMGSPKYAPELVNISTWDDVMIDAAIKYMNVLPEAYDAQKWSDNDGWNPDYEVNYDRDIQPFLERIGDYQWVATVPSMTAFIRPSFDPRDASETNREQREKMLSYFRKPSKMRHATLLEPAALVDGQSNQLFSEATTEDPAAGIPLMPVNAGTNSVRNQIPDKFSVLTDTQYYSLKQWANGKFSSDAAGMTIPNVHPLDAAAIGNCVGEPMCPGIEVTWSVRNPIIYEGLYQIKHRHSEDFYAENGLDPNEDECQPLSWETPRIGLGCEPGDLTKRMAIPWQADFYDCSVQMINFASADSPVKDNETGIPIPPTYYAYWWPPQSPWNVIAGGKTLEEQKRDGVPLGLQVMYSRGVNSFTQMITAWKYLGFIVNQNEDEKFGRQYPYFIERERNYDKFQAVSVGVGNVTSFVTGDDSNYLPSWFLKVEDEEPQNEKASAAPKHSKGLSLEHYHAEVPKKIKEGVRTGRRFGH